MIKYNTDKLVSVKVADKYPSSWYEFRKEISFIGFVLQKSGFHATIFSNGPSDEKELLKDHLIIDNKLYEKPECVLRFQDHSAVRILFDTLEEAKAKQSELTEGKNWITI